MDVSLIYRIAGIGILITILNIFLRQAGREEQAQMLSLAGVIIVLLSLLSLIVQLFSEVEKAFWW
ncbi:MAG TPA: stage III sporulation protein AC [Firmicutes bacterium]|nr:stage III sporulation protein AC [Bacillota bacterium]